MNRNQTLQWLRTFNATARTALIPTDTVLGEVGRLAASRWTPQALAGYLHATHPNLGAAGLAKTLEAIPDAPPTAPPDGSRPRRHRGVVTANTTADIDGTGQPFLVACPACVELHSPGGTTVRRDIERWDGTGQWYAPDLATARQIAASHEGMP